MPYGHNEASILRVAGDSPRLVDVEFEEGGWYDTWADRPDICANLKAWGGPYVDWDRVMLDIMKRSVINGILTLSGVVEVSYASEPFDK
jgi:hypothetical protein